MPSLQLDAPVELAPAARRDLARRLGEVYSRVMQVRPDIVSVVIRDVGPNHVWRCTDAEPTPAALLMCDVRRGRDADTRAALARELIESCAAATGLPGTAVKVEFTQHAGDEMFHAHLGGFNTEWTGEERPG